MSRCIACDTRLSEGELLAIRALPNGNKEPWDLCTPCKRAVQNPDYADALVDTDAQSEIDRIKENF